jgi:hypothetical protein
MKLRLPVLVVLLAVVVGASSAFGPRTAPPRAPKPAPEPPPAIAARP